MPAFAARDLAPKLTALIAAGLLCLSPAFAADEEAPAKGAAVTVLKAAKACFANIVEVSGTIIPREENQVRPERMGLLRHGRRPADAVRLPVRAQLATASVRRRGVAGQGRGRFRVGPLGQSGGLLQQLRGHRKELSE